MVALLPRRCLLSVSRDGEAAFAPYLLLLVPLTCQSQEVEVWGELEAEHPLILHIHGSRLVVQWSPSTHPHSSHTHFICQVQEAYFGIFGDQGSVILGWVFVG